MIPYVNHPTQAEWELVLETIASIEQWEIETLAGSPEEKSDENDDE